MPINIKINPLYDEADDIDTMKDRLKFDIALNEDQTTAENAIIAAWERKEKEFLLKGFAGVGKTYLMQSTANRFTQMSRYKVDSGFKDNRKIRVALTAPTHKAVQVLRRKMIEAGLGHIDCMTIHALLGLKPAVSDSEKQVLKRNPGNSSKTGDYDVIVIDEASMVGNDLQKFIDQDLAFHFVLYIGDPAQLPPVGEEIASIFGSVAERNTFTLSKIVRQAEGNPILKAATALRLQQGGRVDWGWAQPAMDPENGTGIYLCGDDAAEWMKDAFTSEDFKKNNDFFRYIAYTNNQVKTVNRLVRQWIYGNTETPFVVGERIVCRNPILNEFDRPAFSTNQEAIVTSIESGLHTFSFSMLSAAAGQQAVPQWSVDLPVWQVGLAEDGGENEIAVAIFPQDEDRVKQLDRKLVTEAKANRNRWYERFQFIERIADIRAVYALTAHSSQGSTFENAFVDIPDISTRQRSNPLEMQKLLYVAITRASKSVVLIGV